MCVCVCIRKCCEITMPWLTTSQVIFSFSIHTTLGTVQVTEPVIIFTSKYPPHSGAIGLSSYGMEKATLPHFINGHLFCYSFFLTASLPQKEMVYSSLFPWLNNVCQLEKGNLQAEKIVAWYSLCCVEILWVETPLHGRANSLEQNGDRKTSNEIPLPARCD